jgi:hypothetical protein
MSHRKNNRNDPDLYDLFSDYVRDHVRDRSNPNITLCAFGSLPEPSVTHMCIPLENVTTGTGKLFTVTEEFRPGTKLKTEEVADTGVNQFYAYIPFDGPRGSSSKGSKGSKSSKGSSISAYTPHFYVVGVFILIIIAILKTEMRQWEYFLQ